MVCNLQTIIVVLTKKKKKKTIIVVYKMFRFGWGKKFNVYSGMKLGFHLWSWGLKYDLFYFIIIIILRIEIIQK